jgi:hypothetical protein
MSSEPKARVLDITAIERFKAGLAEFGDTVKIGLYEADSEIQRSMIWIERDRIPHWRRQIQLRNEEVATAKSALFRKQMQGNDKDGRPSIVDEKIALERAKSRLKNADERHRSCRRWRNRLSQEFAIFKGHIQGLAAVAEREVPETIALMDRMLVNLEAYLRGEGGAKDEINELIKEGERQAAMNRTVTEELDTKNEDQADSTSDDAERGQT